MIRFVVVFLLAGATVLAMLVASGKSNETPWYADLLVPALLLATMVGGAHNPNEPVFWFASLALVFALFYLLSWPATLILARCGRSRDLRRGED